jgi:hypothetical protein
VQATDFMKADIEKLKRISRDLRKVEPRPSHEDLGGFSKAARCLDKCRASLLGWQGEYTFNCPMDQEFFAESGIDAEEFKAFVATGANDKEVEHWIQDHAHAQR